MFKARNMFFGKKGNKQAKLIGFIDNACRFE